MTFDLADRERRLRNYSVMLKLALFCLAAALFATFTGGLQLVASGEPWFFAYGLFFLIWSAGCAYLFVDSTVTLMEGDTAGRDERSSR